MKKYFFISNRQSGKSQLALYEFLKDPENNLLICLDDQQVKRFKDTGAIEPKYFNRIISANNAIGGKGHRVLKIIFDEYLFIDVKIRKNLHLALMPCGVEEIYCFSTPIKLYDAKMFNFIKQLKKDNKISEIENFISYNQLLIEMNDSSVKTFVETRKELIDLFYNYLTDYDTQIIHNKFFYNQKIYNLDNVSYFPDVDRELTELKGEFIKND